MTNKLVKYLISNRLDRLSNQFVHVVNALPTRVCTAGALAMEEAHIVCAICTAFPDYEIGCLTRAMVIDHEFQVRDGEQMVHEIFLYCLSLFVMQVELNFNFAVLPVHSAEGTGTGARTLCSTVQCRSDKRTQLSRVESYRLVLKPILQGYSASVS
ncbi:hypothetical protein WT81_13820 [Burkholderia stagnalis]|nr:hypothetical protein WT80_14110 [Burkholderia stagnalis]KWK59769.1 hypothetical protein WT81_13820 [Burkholderia stagnalis]